MSELTQLKTRILQDGVDGRIDEADLAMLRQPLPSDGTIDPQDMQVLIELRAAARTVCPAFDAFFFPAFKKQLLSDGKLSPLEQLNLLRLFCAGGADEAEKQFMRELRHDLRESTPALESLCELALGGNC